MVLSTR